MAAAVGEQLVLASHAEVVPEGMYEGVDPEQRMSLIRLLGVVREQYSPPGGIEIQDYWQADPGIIFNGLLIHPTDHRYNHARQLVRLEIGRAHV